MAQIYWGMYISLYLEVIGIMHSRIYTMEWLCVDMVWSDIHISMYIHIYALLDGHSLSSLAPSLNQILMATLIIDQALSFTHVRAC